MRSAPLIGYVATDLQVHFDTVMQVVEEATGTKVEQMQRQLRALGPHADQPRPAGAGSITLVEGTARFVDPHTVEVEGTSAGDSLAMLKARVGAPVLTAEDVGWDGDALEAQGFAYLAMRARLGLPLSLPATTGVAQPMPGGIYHRKP